MSYKVIEIDETIRYDDLENAEKFQYDLQTKFEKQVSYWIDKGYTPVAEVKKETSTAYLSSHYGGITYGKEAYGTNIKWIQAVYRSTNG